MWRRKKPDEFTPFSNPSETPPVTVQDLRPLGLRTPLRPSDSNSLLGKSLSFQGELKGAEDLYIDGEFAGTIELGEHSVTVGPEGRVRADIRAREIIIEGNVQGNLRAGERLQIGRTGSVTGDLVTARIVIEDGAYFKGSIDIERAEEKGQRSEAAAGEDFRVAPTPLSAESKDKLQ